MDGLLAHIGRFLIVVGVIIAVLTFYPVFYQEIRFQILQHSKNSTPLESKLNGTYPYPTPVNRQFSIVIPKINANSAVIANVDPINSGEYQRALTQGVAHAKGTVLPGERGNSFLFSHSSVDFFLASRYNSVFYLLSKLVPGDLVYIFRSERKLTYQVSGSKVVSPSDISYLSPITNDSSSQLTLMTCWPPGTDMKRFVVFSELIEESEYK